MMKKQLIISALLLAIAASASAQQPDTAQVLIHYKFSHLSDTTDKAHPYTENMALYVGKSASAYRSYDNVLENAEFKKQVQAQIANSPDGNVRINRNRRGSGEEIYQFPTKKKLDRKEPLVMNRYLIEDDIPHIEWQISSDTATFGGLHCQKATAHFKGRDYTAWFCPDIPLHVGPWKLNGLPGVIVQAYDTRKDVRFMFDGIEKVAMVIKPDDQSAPVKNGGQGPMIITIDGGDGDDPNIIQIPKDAIKTTDKEFAKLQDAMRKDPDAFVQSMMASHNANMPANAPRPQIKIKMGPSPVINNPIELPEKK
jgi:GLPGLI family protein